MKTVFTAVFVVMCFVATAQPGDPGQDPDTAPPPKEKQKKEVLRPAPPRWTPWIWWMIARQRYFVFL